MSTSTAPSSATSRKPSGILDYHQKELAAYLARARGPGESAMKVKLEPRPSGEAARVMFKEYDVPLDPDAGLPGQLRAERRQRLVARHAVRPDPGLGHP